MDPLIGRVVLDRYEVLRRIGSGGMGSVYVGRQLAVGREIAMKVLRPDLMSNEKVRERFRREAEIIGRLRHPNTIQLVDYGETDDGLAVMVMELLVGQPLNDRLKQDGPLPLADALRVGMEVAGALGEAHAAGLVHRDLKPANIFLVEVTGKYHAKVLDFGIARMLDEEATRITSTGQVFGTPRYMSPEQGLSTGEVDHRSDIYSLGLIIFECLVGQPPFVANTSLQYLSAHATMPPPKLRDHVQGAPFDLELMIDRCLAKNPDDRPQTAQDVGDQLKLIDFKLQKDGLGAFTAPQASNVQSAATLPAADATLPPIAPPTMRASQAPASVAPSGTGKPGSSRALYVAAAAFALIAAVLFAGVRYVKKGGGAVTVEQADLGVSADEDAGMVGLALAQPLDAGESAMVETPDAGEAEVELPDAGEAGEEALDAEVTDRHRGRKPKKPKKPKQLQSEGGGVGVGGISGPRAMWLPVEGGEPGPIEIAQRCKKSELRAGPAVLSLGKCPKDCAVIVDGTCAGRTPFEKRGVPTGNKNVTVVCGKRVRIDTIARLRADEQTTLNCR